MLDKGIFYIKYFAKKHGKIIERQKYFDMEKDGIRCASKKWEINNVRTL